MAEFVKVHSETDPGFKLSEFNFVMKLSYH